jgi:hypothetical protein
MDVCYGVHRTLKNGQRTVQESHRRLHVSFRADVIVGAAAIPTTPIA